MADDKIQQAAQQVQERAVPAVKDVTDGTVRPAADRAAAQVTLPPPRSTNLARILHRA